MASSSRSSPSTPAFSPLSWSNHVFLSFRGEDIRQRFLGHLYEALVGSSIETYMDDKKLPLGGPIATSLIKAIKESQIAVTIFSKNYGDSSWCLNELVCIMDCKKKTGLKVVPIFYDVEPTEVRNQTGTYGEAFARHETSEKDANLVVSWRGALKEACGLSGQHFNNKAETYESELIKKVVNKIRKMIRPLTPGPVDDNLVGMEERMDELITKFQIGSDNGKIMIGIWGVGGGGKTTLANSVYHRVSGEFDGCCCIDNIRDQSSKIGLEALQGKILSSVLKNEETRAGSVGEGKYKIRDALSNKKVLIVLDDVHHLDQLEALAGSLDWFGDGSRILITTRNKNLLTAHKVVEVHEVSLLNRKEARKLFRKRAGLEYTEEEEDYTELSEEVFTYASGLPLALKVLGSSLVGRVMKEWKSTLDSLKTIPPHDIVGQLKISYEGLTKVQKDLFLDIACFFRGQNVNSAMEILEACGFNPDIELKVLRERALITVSEYGRFDMHDLVQEMGHHIVRGEGAYHNEPERHSRVWMKKDVLTICSMEATRDVDMIEAIRFDNHLVEENSDNKNLLGCLPPLVANSKNLRWIEWEGDLAGPLLTKFPPTKLCYLRLHYSNQKLLWEGYKNLPNLKTLVLRNMSNLIITPNFDGIPNLKRFELSGSNFLKEIDSSIGSLEKLDCLRIDWCKGLTMFPSISRLKNLETLSLFGCHRMFSLPEIQQSSGGLRKSHLSSYCHLKKYFCCAFCDVDECDLEEHSFFLNSALEEHSIAHYNMNHIPSRVLSSLLQQLTGLRKLNLRWCGLGNENIGSGIWELPNLQELRLAMNEFSCLDFSRLRVPKLKLLDVSYCSSLVSLSNLPSSIAVINAMNCTSLETFGEISDCKWLWKVRHGGWGSIDLINGEVLLRDMLKGNAIEDHFISVSLPNQFPRGFVGTFFGGKSFTKCVTHVRSRGGIPIWDTYTLRLPDDWYNDFCGFFMRFVTEEDSPIYYWGIKISIMKQGLDEEGSRFEVWQESYEAPEPQYDGDMKTYVGYVSFGLLRRTASLNSSFNIISFSIDQRFYSSFAAELVPMNNKDAPVQTIDCSNFWHEPRETFEIHHDYSKSRICISWKP